MPIRRLAVPGARGFCWHAKVGGIREPVVRLPSPYVAACLCCFIAFGALSSTTMNGSPISIPCSADASLQITPQEGKLLLDFTAPGIDQPGAPALPRHR